MKKYINGKYITLSDNEIKQVEKEENSYLNNINRDESVNSKIRERYTQSQEFAILRQKDEKPDEYAEYYAYCEECKNAVKESMQGSEQYGN
ncbi:MAG: hypothetical protein IKY39_02245 [Clostridia bacterium]|nr:hypothetical protein [Clostridia bacterium]